MRAKNHCSLLPAISAVLLLAAIGGSAAASFVWDGSGDPTAAGFTLMPSGTGVPFTFDWCNEQACTGIAYQNTSALEMGRYSLDSAASEFVRADGWFVETRVQVKQNTSDAFGVYLLAGDDLGGLGLLLRSSNIQVYGSDWGTHPNPLSIIYTNANYHDIRIEVAAGGTTGLVYVDDMVNAAAAITLPNDAGAKLVFGDGSSGSAGSAYWDHLVVNAAAPAPTTPPPLPGSGLNIDATFSSGALPTNFGMVAGGNVDPVPGVSGGVWTNNCLAGDTSNWKSADLPSEIVGPVIHGFAEVSQATLGGTSDDQTVVALGTGIAGSVAFVVSFGDGKMTCLDNDSTLNEVAVANQDGGKHVYGWEANILDGTLKLFFNDYQVGETGGYDVSGNIFDEELLYFGDASGGNAHSEVWDRWVVAEGAYTSKIPHPGDATLDGKVDEQDAAALAAHWLTNTGATWTMGDFNNDGAVTDIDATIMATNWHYGVTAANASVPESGMIALLAGLLSAAAVFRRGK